MQKPEELISLSDPGEIGRDEHNRGDRFVVWVSNLFAWLFPILMVAICAQVILRGSGMNQAWLDDFQWWLYGAAVMMGIGYAVTTNSHVRVDILYEHFPKPKQTRIEIFALVWLFLPFILLSWDVTVHYAIASVIADEGSDSPNGLHNLWLLKVFMNSSFIFIAIAIWAAYVRNLSKLTRPTLFRQLFWAFPSTMLVINYITFYAIWWFEFARRDEGMTTREVSRQPIFGEFDLGNYEIKYTIAITLAITILVLLAARLLQRTEPGEA